MIADNCYKVFACAETRVDPIPNITRFLLKLFFPQKILILDTCDSYWISYLFIFFSFAFVLVWAFNVLRRNIWIYILKHICSFSHDEKLRHVCLGFVNLINEFFLLSSTRWVEWKRERGEDIAKITQIAKLLNEKFSGDWKVQTTWCIDFIARLSHDANSSRLRFFVSLLLLKS